MINVDPSDLVRSVLLNFTRHEGTFGEVMLTFTLKYDIVSRTDNVMVCWLFYFDFLKFPSKKNICYLLLFFNEKKLLSCTINLENICVHLLTIIMLKYFTIWFQGMLLTYNAIKIQNGSSYLWNISIHNSVNHKSSTIFF